MASRSIIIIGAGMGGMAAGIYGQLSGYRTRIFEMHNVPGGQCASWQRRGYTFDACIHHLMGCSPRTRIYSLWQELGVMPRELVYNKECVSVLSPEGRMFHDYYDLELLGEHMQELAPGDKKMIREYINAIKPLIKKDIWGDMMLGGPTAMVGLLPTLAKTFKWFKPTMADMGRRFSDPFMRRAFPLLVYSMPFMPAIFHLARHGYGAMGDIAWPVGASAEFAASMAHRYTELGGEINYRCRVDKILTRGNKAVGVRLEDGTEEYGDIVISNADGRKTLLHLLEGRFMNKQLAEYCREPEDETNWAVHVFLGVKRDLSGEPSSLVMFLPETVTIAGRALSSLEMQLYGFDRSMAPEGHGVIKVELFSRYSYWKELARDQASYEEEKAKVAAQVLHILESYFNGVKSQVEAVDVPTLLTWERFMGGTHGFVNMPSKKPDLMGSLFRNRDMFIPGLENFYFVGAWATSAGALFINAHSGKKAIRYICKKDGRSFSVKT